MILLTLHHGACNSIELFDAYQNNNNVIVLNSDSQKNYYNNINNFNEEKYRTVENAKKCGCLDHCTVHKEHRNAENAKLFTGDEILFLLKLDHLIGDLNNKNKFFDFLSDVGYFIKFNDAEQNKKAKITGMEAELAGVGSAVARGNTCCKYKKM